MSSFFLAVGFSFFSALLSASSLGPWGFFTAVGFLLLIITNEYF